MVSIYLSIHFFESLALESGLVLDRRQVRCASKFRRVDYLSICYVDSVTFSLIGSPFFSPLLNLESKFLQHLHRNDRLCFVTVNPTTTDVSVIFSADQC